MAKGQEKKVKLNQPKLSIADKKKKKKEKAATKGWKYVRGSSIRATLLRAESAS